MGTESKWIPIAVRARVHGTATGRDANMPKMVLLWTELPDAPMTMLQAWHALADGRILLACRHTHDEVIAVIQPTTPPKTTIPKPKRSPMSAYEGVLAANRKYK